MILIIVLILLLLICIYFLYKYTRHGVIDLFGYRILENPELLLNNDETTNIEQEKKEQYPTNSILFKINVNNKVGNVVCKLYDDVVPKTAHNFRQLVKEQKYKGTSFHRIIKDFMIQGGDFTRGDGTGGESIYGEKFDDENFQIKHNKPGLLSMANSGPNTNGSQFFITTTNTPHLDGKHVVFGEVISGMDIIEVLNLVDTDGQDKPIVSCQIMDCYVVT